MLNLAEMLASVRKNASMQTPVHGTSGGDLVFTGTFVTVPGLSADGWKAFPLMIAVPRERCFFPYRSLPIGLICEVGGQPRLPVLLSVLVWQSCHSDCYANIFFCLINV